MNQSTLSKILIAFSFCLLFGCGDSSEIRHKTANINANKSIEATPTPLSAADLAEKTKIEEALKKAGFTDITVDTTTAPFSIRGTVARDKMVEVIFIAQQAAGKNLKNELIEKK